MNGKNVIYFNAVRQMIRPALELYNGRIYIASGSHGDNQPYHGWILTYDASSLVCNGAWNATPNGSEGEAGIWQGGGGVVIDSDGFVYFQTGNGDFDGENSNGITGLDGNGFPDAGDYGDCFVKLELDSNSSEGSQNGNLNGWGLKVVDYFSPSNNHALDAVDEDLGSGGPTILPDSAGSATYPHLLIGGGKEGTLYLINRDNMGKYGTTDNVVQEFTGALSGSLSVPAYFNNTLYATAGYGGNTMSWPLTNGSISTDDAQTSPDQIAFPGCSAYISASGTTDGIVWVIDKGTGELRAYDASNLSSELWTSNQNEARDGLGTSVKFSVPTPANGRVYVGTADHLVVYGPPGSATAPPAAPTDLNAFETGPSTISLSWTSNSDNETGFAIERSTDGMNFNQIATVAANVTTYGDSGLSSDMTYFYQVRAYNLYDTLSYSAYTNIASATTASAGAQVPVDLYHFDEGSGTTTTDAVGGNNGTLIGNTPPAWTIPGRLGNSDLSFSGDGQYAENGESAVQVTNDLSPILGSTSSLLFWINTTQTGNDIHWMAPAVTGVEQTGDANDINWGYLDSEGHIGVAVGDSGSVLSVNPVNDGQWHHIALTRDAIAGTVNVYVDGALSATGTLETGNKTSLFYLIGALSVVDMDGVTFSGANYFNGQLDDVQIYNSVASPAIVAAVASAPAPPTNLTVTAASTTELDLNWTNNATTQTGYQVWSSLNGGAWTDIADLPADATSYMDTGLDQDTPYSYYVTAVNSAGVAQSKIVSSATPIPPATPTNPTVTYLSPTEVDLAWVNNANNATNYYIYRNTGDSTFTQVGSLAGNATSFQDTNVQPAMSYNYHIEAYNAAGFSDFAGIAVTTPAASTYASWVASYPTLIDTSPSADPENDGISNLLAYAFNLDPTVQNFSGLPMTTVQNGYMTISYVQVITATDLVYTVQVSSDLINWNSGSSYTTQVSTTPINSTTQMVTVRDNIAIDPVNAPRRFIRLEVSQQ